jgi:hypothetical protein
MESRPSEIPGLDNHFLNNKPGFSLQPPFVLIQTFPTSFIQGDISQDYNTPTSDRLKAKAGVREAPACFANQSLLAT